MNDKEISLSITYTDELSELTTLTRKELVLKSRF